MDTVLRLCPSLPTETLSYGLFRQQLRSSFPEIPENITHSNIFCTEVQKQSCTNKMPNEELTLLALYWALLMTFQRNADQTILLLMPRTPIKNTENLLLQGSEWSLYISLHSCRLQHKIRHKPPLCKLSILLWINFHTTAKCLLGGKKEKKKKRQERNNTSSTEHNNTIKSRTTIHALYSTNVLYAIQ